MTGLEIKRAGATAPEHTPPVTSPAESFRPPADPKVDRLLQSPIFVMAPVRSGSTLLRMLLGAHSKLHAPHELHVRRLQVELSTKLARQAMAALDLSRTDLEHLLWDRVLHREVTRTGKSFVVDKTPSNAFIWKRISACWPDARFIFLLRHPMSIARSWHDSKPGEREQHEAALDALRYMNAVERARKGLPGLTVRYEDLTTDPEGETRRICAFLGIDWEQAMLDYGGGGEIYQKGLGDWHDKIRSGRVQKGRPIPATGEVPEELLEICRAWEYTK
jgi:hypothetical protein